ncbi:MAG: hypothetical protein AMS24_04035 [Chlamydiae bacterium SM23_39]|nr:MAG: hypothetical protein AMS24_04035 [Chlamydiae bacterium SM23_39]
MKLFYKIFLIIFCISKINGELLVHNSILAKIDEKCISVLDVKKKMDLIFLKVFPHLKESKESKYKFYITNWEQVFYDIIKEELMILDAEKKEIKITDGEIREKLEDRFGPNTMESLEEIDLSFDEAWDFIKREMVVERMLWYFVHSKVDQKITPEIIKKNYIIFCKNNPPIEKWRYKTISIKVDDKKTEKEIGDKIFNLLKISKKELDEKELKEKFKDISITISSECEISSKEISNELKEILKELKPNSYSIPISKKSRISKKDVLKIFYLKNYEITPTPSFNDSFLKIKEELFQKEYQKEYLRYFSELFKYYNYEEIDLKDLTPFEIR